MTRRGLLAALGALVVGGRASAVTQVELHIDGHHIFESLKRLKRQRGEGLGLG